MKNRNRLWDEQLLQRLKLHEEGKSNTQIAKLTGGDASYVSKQIQGVLAEMDGT